MTALSLSKAADGGDAVSQYMVRVRGPGDVTAVGRLDVGHLADHPAAAAALAECLQVHIFRNKLLIQRWFTHSPELKNALGSLHVTGQLRH